VVQHVQDVLRCYCVERETGEFLLVVVVFERVKDFPHHPHRRLLADQVKIGARVPTGFLCQLVVVEPSVDNQVALSVAGRKEPAFASKYTTKVNNEANFCVLRCRRFS